MCNNYNNNHNNKTASSKTHFLEALKSELASKDRLLAEKSEKEKEVEERKRESKGVIDSMQEQLTCVICQELFVQAHKLSCAHSFCKNSIEEWMKSKRECPVCRKTLSTVLVRSLVLDTVEPPKRGHFGNSTFVLSSEVVLFSEVV